jgi:hypothetical protein
MPDITDQLRDWSDSLAQAVEPVDLEAITSASTTRETPDLDRRWLAVAAAVVVVGVGLGAVAALGNGEQRQAGTATIPATTPSATSPTSESGAVSAPPPTTTESSPTATASAPPNPQDRLEAWPAAPAAPVPVDDIPRFLPEAPITIAGTPVRWQANGGIAAAPMFTQVFADAERDILVTLQTQPNSIESTPAELRQPITIAGWDDTFITDGSVRVVASDPSGYVRLTATGIDNEQAAGIIASMQRRPGGVPGWDLGPGNAELVEINGAWNDAAGQHVVTWFAGDRVVAQMLTSPSHTDLIAQSLAPTFDRVNVNGVDGWLNPSDTRRTLVWSPDGTNIIVLGVADARIDPLDLASSITEVDAAEYNARTATEVPVGVGDGCDASLFC